MKAIPTHYNGHVFRSRLEAKWAVLFDQIGIKWVYEPEGYILDNGTWYLPDFYLTELDCYAEVKPKQFTEDEYNKSAGLDKPCILLDTDNPTLSALFFCTGTGITAYEDMGLTKLKNYDNFETYLSGEVFSRIVLSASHHKHRLWFSFGEPIETYCIDTAPEILAKNYFGINPFINRGHGG